MNPERFAELVEAYGAEPRRWPSALRAAAELWAQAHPEEAADALRVARRLDAVLDRHVVQVPGARLTAAVVDSASSLRAMARRARLWRRGAGLAGLGLVGAMAGALAVAVLLPMTAPADEDGAYAATAFTDMTQMMDE